MAVTHETRHMYRVCWASMVGRACGQGRPLPREVAEFVVHDEELAHPMRRYWLEVCDEARPVAPVAAPPAPRSAKPGRTRH